MSGASKNGRMRRVAANVSALAKGQDLLGRNETLDRRLRGDEMQWRRVIGVVLERHYGGVTEPPPELRGHVGSNDGALNFWSKGIASSELVLEQFGTEPTAPVLDWGCGSGRTLVWLKAYDAWREHYHGCDVDKDAIAWLEQQGEATVAVCGDDPPLPYDDAYFGGLFSFSVLTHIPPEHHRAWWTELRRVLAPGALACVTLQSAADARASADLEDSVSSTGAGHEDRPGHYKHVSVATEQFTREAIGDLLTVEAYRPHGYLNQDLVLARRPA